MSKKKLDMASQEEYHERLSEKFDKIEREKKSKEAAAHGQKDDGSLTAAGGRILLVTHVNTFLYAACFFIQVGTLPVSSNMYLSQGLPRTPLITECAHMWVETNSLRYSMFIFPYGQLLLYYSTSLRYNQRISSTRRVLAGKYTVAACFVAPSVL